VIVFFNSGRENPRASLAATYASGYPVALDARAELLDSLALTSMMQYYHDIRAMSHVYRRGKGDHLVRVRVKSILDVTLPNNAKMTDGLDGYTTQSVVIRVGQCL